MPDHEDGPSLHTLVDTIDVAARHLIMRVREQLNDTEACVQVTHMSGAGWHAIIETTRGAVIRVGCLYKHAAEEIKTFAELIEQLTAAVEHSEEINGRRSTRSPA